MSSALLLIDIQNDYFPGGANPLIGIEEACNNAKKILTFFRDKKLPVIHIQHISIRKGATFFLPNTNGVEINKCVKPLSSEEVIQKYFPNSFRNTNLLEKLRELGVENLNIVGAMTHMCIDATTRAAFDLGFNCSVIEDACATKDLEFNGKIIPAADVHGSFMAALKSAYARVFNCEEQMKNFENDIKGK
jgi:nicotinamidase-related amidase